MSRIKYKGFFLKINLIKKKKWIKIYNKSLIILSKYINYYIYVYNGKNFIPLKITNKMVGYKFGEFISTKKQHKFKKKNKSGSKNNTNKFKIK